MDKRTREKRNSVIKDCFRDIADKDYILARSAWRHDLSGQFLWMSLQAIEKYLKSILLYHDENTKDIKHNLIKAIRRIESRCLNDCIFDEDTKKFCEKINVFGLDRYLGFPRNTHGIDMLRLDATVWKIRRFCQDLHFLEFHGDDLPPRYPSYEDYLDYLKSDKCIKEKIEFRLIIPKGYLEKVLDTKKYPMQRQTLIWKNQYFGLRRKGHFKIKLRWKYQKPTHFSYPEIFPWAKERIKFSNEIIEYFENLNQNDAS